MLDLKVLLRRRFLAQINGNSLGDQYKQCCTVSALRRFNVPSLKVLNESTITQVADWAMNAKPTQISFPDECRKIIHELVRQHEKPPV